MGTDGRVDYLVMRSIDGETLGDSIRLDFHPDGRRIAIELLESMQADIGMIDNAR